jgi:hypothetical protein
LYLEKETPAKIKSHYRDMLYGVTKHTGKKTLIDKHYPEVYRYDLITKKLGLNVFLFKNNTHGKFMINTDFYIKGDYACEMDWQNPDRIDQEAAGKVNIRVSGKCSKLVIFKFNKKATSGARNCVIPNNSKIDRIRSG